MGNEPSTAQPEPDHLYARQARLDGHATPLAKALSDVGKPNSWLARKIGVNRSTVGRWVKGEIPVPEEHQGKVARFVRVRRAELFK